METIKNPHGISINKCCLSCRHMTYETRNTTTDGCNVIRYCARSARRKTVHSGTGCCEHWHLKAPYEKLGATPKGRIQKPAFLHYLIEQQAEVHQRNEAIRKANIVRAKQGLPRLAEQWVDAEAIRNEWEAKHGSSYLRV